ncbi:MAG: RdgB/HAM1 family non-canonical purine NTP pyrophosphatase [Deltaproteobacteria bacterium]|jgi:XTP/dITP diphosphohydrolase|nr:RdgB/HAM1 family non-canonical purine NTP pyrophosphatase [Deltaproteobacteria bacterium]
MSAPSILLATSNPGKIREYLSLFSPLGLNFMTLADLPQPVPEPRETGADFLANALLKARYYARVSSRPALADDSGLLVEALGGRPGVNSARYGGPGLSDAARCALLLKEMAASSNRRAKFQAVLVLAGPSEEYLSFEGELAGEILEKPLGEGGFGYDPVFLELQTGLTLAQMTLEAKNSLSHRAKAGAALRRNLDQVANFIANCAAKEKS